MAGQNLSPVPKRHVRIVVWILLTLLALYCGRHWGEKIGVSLLIPLIIGTYRRFRVSPGMIKQRWTVAFIDRPPTSFKFSRYSRIEVTHAAQTTYGEMMMFGALAIIFGSILDNFFPWLGGSYQIWLTKGINEQVLAWQGNSETHFKENLEFLQSASGLEVMVR
ncbi:hypothetical protein N8590_02520 [bacterium]|nr:hypothetical protein [Planctomicrobium sp.]MDA7503918.1 hypothetical protein [bacterium]MDA7527839.1 hypothetical protein [bacterium]MDB4731583.1 hypothetical protein [bacterium]